MTWIFSLIFAFAFDIYLPLIPELRSALETTQGNLQLFFSIYLIFAAIAQLIVTRIDSRRILFYGSIAFVCGTIACIAAQTLTLLLIARAFQAFGASLFLSRSYQGAIVAVSLLLAPTLGAILIYWLGPIGPSIFLLLLGILASVAAQTTPREAPQNPNINFLQTLKNPKFTLFALVQASGFSLFSLFCCSSPYFFINLLEMTKYQFGVAFSGVILSQLLGSLVAKMIHRKSGTEALLVLGITTLFITGLAMLFGYLAVGLTVKSILIPVSLLTFAVAFLTHAGRVGALAEEIKATRMLRAMSYLTAAFIGSIFMQFEVSSLIPFSTLIVALSLITLLGSYYTLQKDETTQST